MDSIFWNFSEAHFAIKQLQYIILKNLYQILNKINEKYYMENDLFISLGNLCNYVTLNIDKVFENIIPYTSFFRRKNAHYSLKSIFYLDGSFWEKPTVWMPKYAISIDSLGFLRSGLVMTYELGDCNLLHW